MFLQFFSLTLVPSLSSKIWLLKKLGSPLALPEFAPAKPSSLCPKRIDPPARPRPAGGPPRSCPSVAPPTSSAPKPFLMIAPHHSGGGFPTSCGPRGVCVCVCAKKGPDVHRIQGPSILRMGPAGQPRADGRRDGDVNILIQFPASPVHPPFFSSSTAISHFRFPTRP